jgi:ferrochelatase
VNGIIAPFRTAKSAEAYEKIWTEQGSPLISISQRLATQLQQQGIAEALVKLSLEGVRQLFVIPMFPHYAMSSYESTVMKVRSVADRVTPWISLDILPPFFDHPRYIRALVDITNLSLHQANCDHVLFSFHGVPERHIRKADRSGRHCFHAQNCCETPAPAHATCYRRQCIATVAAFASQAKLAARSYSYSFQSRLGRDKWLEPPTQDQLMHLARSGVRRLAVICPAFTVDCLETLEELGIRGKQAFLAEGGAEFHLIPCLNDHPVWAKALAQIARQFAAVSEASNCAAGALMR